MQKHQTEVTTTMLGHRSEVIEDENQSEPGAKPAGKDGTFRSPELVELSLSLAPRSTVYSRDVRIAEDLFWQVERTGAAIAILVAVLASLAPARGAASVPPIVAMRSE